MGCKNALFEALNLNLNTRIIRLLRTRSNFLQGCANAPVAQLDRVAGSDPVGRGFDSLLARHFKFSVRLNYKSLDALSISMRL